MDSVPRRSRARRLGLILALVLSAPPTGVADAAATTASVEDVMRLLADSGSVRASFHERKYVHLLTDPIETRGKLFFQPPDRMARHVETPAPVWMAIRDEEVALRDGRGEQRFDLGQSDVGRSLVDGLAVVLRGDLALLTARYEIAFEAGDAGWQIVLTPRSRALRVLIASMIIDGVGSEIRRIEVREEGGDSTVTEFSDIEAGLRFTPEETDEIFLLTRPSPQPHD
ncbi:MAG: outer membrane lipoprotein carrier protein LolA [Deltaproteobacteria bacterium]|nr:outer membrane lipoprotein carrier protein LolA [Deltaproteobacteria bacterium]